MKYVKPVMSYGSQTQTTNKNIIKIVKYCSERDGEIYVKNNKKGQEEKLSDNRDNEIRGCRQDGDGKEMEVSRSEREITDGLRR